MINLVTRIVPRSGYFGTVWLFWYSLVISVQSGYFGTVWLFWYSLVILVQSGFFGTVWLFWLSLVILVQSGYFSVTIMGQFISFSLAVHRKRLSVLSFFV